METRTVEQVESWKTRSFSDGFADLRELSNGEFSGAVTAGGAWLFMLNGRIIGVYEGSLDDFEDASGTAYAAPHPSLPLLFSMREQGGETQAKYYTNDTPLSEVDSTLTDGKFTGFIELSENVLSGDYYVAYYGGRSMSVAFVGASEQVVTGEDAFERANDEVGIYEVRNVDIEVTDVPEPEEPDEAPGGASGGATGTSDAGGVSDASGVSDVTSGSSGPTGASETAADAGIGGSGPSDGAADTGSGGQSSAAGQSPAGQTAEAKSDSVASDSEPTASERDQSGTAQNQSVTTDTDSGTRAASASASDAGASDAGVGDASGTGDAGARDASPSEAGTSDAGASDAGVGDASGTGDAGARDASPSEAGTSDAGASEQVAESVETVGSESAAEPTRPEAGQSGAQTDAASDSESESAGGDAFDEEEQWREATTIPSLDPDRSEGPDEDAVGESGQNAAAEGRTESASPETASRGQSSGASSQASSRDSKSGAGAQSGASAQSGNSSSAAGSRGTGSEADSRSESASGGQSGGSDEKTQETIQKLRSQLRQRKQQVQKLKDRLSNVESERNEYKRERDALRQEVERLEAKLETTGSSGSSSGRQLSRSQAFDGTNLFVRYESKGKATLEKAAEGEAKPEDVNANLRLEHHTQFETKGAEVEGEPFEAFLTGSFEYQFVSWVIEELLYEIRDTGHRNSLKDLYESIPKIDRVDFHGSVGAGGDSEDTRQESFNIIMRDRMGNPLVVADLNDSRDPTTGDMMGSLVDASSGVAQAHDELAGAFQVTESFFEPKALETAENATAGGFLSREKRESFVKLSRKRGYHLCLVESRSGGFHLNVPEL